MRRASEKQIRRILPFPKRMTDDYSSTFFYEACLDINSSLGQKSFSFIADCCMVPLIAIVSGVLLED